MRWLCGPLGSQWRTLSKAGGGAGLQLSCIEGGGSVDLWAASGEHWVRLGVGQDYSSHV